MTFTTFIKEFPLNFQRNTLQIITWELRVTKRHKTISKVLFNFFLPSSQFPNTYSRSSYHKKEEYLGKYVSMGCDINHHFINSSVFSSREEVYVSDVEVNCFMHVEIGFFILFVLSVYSIPSVTWSSGMKTQIVITTNKLISLHHRQQVMLLSICFRWKFWGGNFVWEKNFLDFLHFAS